MEMVTFVDKEVIEKAKNMLTLQIDVTDNTEEDQVLLKRFSLIGPPAILFFDRNGQEFKNQRLVGYTDAKTLVKHMKAVTINNN
jgi:thiol:disulfide interchange protein DsbD